MTSPEPDPERCCFDEWASSNAKRARDREVVAGISEHLLEALSSAGLRGRTVLDLGCGTGDLALAALGRGATTATGVDLGPGAIREARALAVERHLEDRAAFRVGDASEVPLERHDVVVLNRVLCCYRDAGPLVGNSLSAAGRIFAFTAPLSSGVAGIVARTQARLGNVWYRMRDAKFQGFRVYIHDLDAIDRRIRAAGFRPVVEGRRRVVWHLAVYERAS